MTMGDRLPRGSGWDVFDAIRRDGSYDVHQKRDHVQMKHDDKPGRRVTIDRNRHDILPPKTLKSVLKQADMTVERLKELL
jgi:predicted RNA binding protein YcfA (HicA-like mRNA interferase family)